MGLKKYGKGDWRNISRNFVGTRTPTQVASHAQKYFIRQLSCGKDKRRASIHDITTVNLQENHIPLEEYKRSTSPEKCKFKWNLPNSESITMDFNQTHGDFFMPPRYGGDSFGSGGALQDSYCAPPNLGFQMQPAMHYPHG